METSNSEAQSKSELQVNSWIQNVWTLISWIRSSHSLLVNKKFENDVFESDFGA